MRTVLPLRESRMAIIRRGREAHVGQKIVSSPWTSLPKRFLGSPRSIVVAPAVRTSPAARVVGLLTATRSVAISCVNLSVELALRKFGDNPLRDSAVSPDRYPSDGSL